MTSISILLPRPCSIVTFLCIFTISILIKDVEASYPHYREILDDLPKRRDMEKYLTSLEKVVAFANQYKIYVDIHFCFGLFLVNVNLRPIVHKLFTRLPNDIKARIVEVLKLTDKAVAYFQHMVDTTLEKVNPDESPEMYIAALFYKNEVTFVKRLQKYKPNLLVITKFYSSQELQEIYSEWSDYLEKVFDFDNCIPNPDQSLKCIGHLDKSDDASHNFANSEVHGARCITGVNRCAKMVLNGTDYGYAILHRLLYLIMGRFSRGCSLISDVKDRQIIDGLCAKMYNEAEYIAQHDLRMPYLSMAQISLCSLEGHVQFIRRSWINTLLDYQTDVGCSGRWISVSQDKRKTSINPADTDWDIHIRDPIMGGLCNTPTTGASTSMLAAAIRYIIEKFYL